jgi:hypothetical protein
MIHALSVTRPAIQDDGADRVGVLRAVARPERDVATGEGMSRF